MDVKPTEAELNILNEMISFIESHKKWYRQIDVGLCLIKSNDKWRIIQGRIYVEPNLDESQPEQTLNYENIILTRFKVLF